MLRAAAAMAMLALGCLAAAVYTVPRGPPERATAASRAWDYPPAVRMARDNARAALQAHGVAVHAASRPGGYPYSGMR